ncbi:unnamed protein product [Rotaria sordida]|uniref:Uncharacterized protein n=1 Tax=Rotaria sordida TaxID=392033 RepID=A0A814BRF6_9BILA|nr:unnamed protein product [Rotaria sordida]CAF0930190.1 unnamed protein product [Rotaria sordida]CAF1057405.1 unnamed protein product [Rotaria sordida]CAF1220829.1 unnamed protein product [Rotaria sordida]
MTINLLVYANDDRIADLVFEPDLLWKNQNVTLSFVNGDQEKQLHFRCIYFQWFLSTHIHFKEVPLSHSADIRVGFGLDKQQSWSLIGSNSAFFSYNVKSGLDTTTILICLLIFTACCALLLFTKNRRMEYATRSMLAEEQFIEP